MSIDFLDPATSAVFTPSGRLSRAIPTSGKLTGIELRLLPPFVKDNNTEPFFPFPGFSKLYCLTIVVSDIGNQLVGGIDLQGFPRIGDNEHLPNNKPRRYQSGCSCTSTASSTWSLSSPRVAGLAAGLWALTITSISKSTF